ncbi:hypothetical protein [Maridesulfovibrio hydrothermalis]|uniref:Uncharacterized protein n=1 Tax=Maridesulfovibrio hydrothermalis AM13 = DSM 14728 TaxID=1121451 RepID=L0RBZ8_9BACT|nr:hypothetical protein [Maridesulfovibrio hydrothermalis]CCO23747.1 protein of unknown function [Maridesulfovibrio hydrothermalis AM13 = DSM 14728]
MGALKGIFNAFDFSTFHAAPFLMALLSAPVVFVIIYFALKKKCSERLYTEFEQKTSIILGQCKKEIRIYPVLFALGAFAIVWAVAKYS